ncbi:MAG: toprim domain-containing protein [Paludibacteraceae bacterium]|nr:toprim domain-containing protein [Paludibacteraceae bacterium]MCK9615610.1 toprim domain-containing protein [Candidatus Omnitrophota bacterium]
MSQQEDRSEVWERYRDIKWLMEIIDLPLCLDRLNIEMSKTTGLNWEGFCPDHMLFKGCLPSDPRWYINTDTGETCCQTEGRGSNILFIAARLLKIPNSQRVSEEDCEKAISFLAGRDISENDISFLRTQSLLKRISCPKKVSVTPGKRYVDEIEKGMKTGYLSSQAINYFLSPVGKPQTNINIDTLKHFHVFERTTGKYVNRATIPIIMMGKVEGFVAIDILGKQEWIKLHPTLEEKDYRKTVYPGLYAGFSKKDIVYGYDECEKNADFIILTEGAREVMKLWQEGFKNSLAILGAYMNDEQILLLTKLAPKKVVLMFDGDGPGRKISQKVKERLEKLFTVEVVELPDGVDPKQLDRNQIHFFLEKAK